MKKKHLRSLGSTEKWLEKENLLSDELKTAFHSIRKVIDSVEDISPEAPKDLPPPAEIAEDAMAIALYSDGGCRGNPGPGAFAYVVQDHSGTILVEGVEFESMTTNNKMELSGPIKGLRDLKDVLPALGKDPLLTRVKVVTDSKYVVDGMKSWVSGWKARGWKKADNKVPENVELWQELDQVKNNFMEIEWVWVRGHIGHPQNEYCDRKANETMDENLT
jgi:ribonuclease HI